MVLKTYGKIGSFLSIYRLGKMV